MPPDVRPVRPSLPAGWTTGTIENLFAPLEDERTLHQGWSPQCEKEPSPSEDVWGVLKTTAIQAGEFQPEHNKQLPDKLTPRPLIEVKEGDILITCAGPRARCGVACLVRRTRKRLMMSGKMYRFRVDPKRHDARYVEAFLQTEQARQAIDKMKTGGSDSGLNLTHDRFRQLPVPVAPLAEQRRIVSEIEKQFTRLEAGVAALRRVQANLHRYRAAVLKAACEGPWKRLSVSEIGKAVTGSTPSTKDPGNFGGDVPFFKPTDLNAGYYVREAREHLTAQGAKLARQLPERAVLVTCIGATIGKTGLARVACATNQQINALVVDRRVAIPEWAFWCFVSPDGQKQIKENASATTLPILNKSRFENLELPLPPLAEQERIVAEVERRLSVVSELAEVVEANLTRATRLRQSILQQAFDGRLVRQNQGGAA